MNISSNRWKKLFLFCLGLSLASALCMKWMESDLWVNGEKFSIMGLELFYAKEKLFTILSRLDGHVKMILSYHLHFDFVFMAGVYPAITALCMMARERVNNAVLKKFLFILAALQLLAWAADIRENLYLLNWMKKPVIRNEFSLYHFIVATKWVIAITGALLSTSVMILPGPERKLK
ncbi:MAG: hypothetical protein Q8941_16245 [Bacteroidota bacterium]|nr:hypothetical protein [Bacteroidota bacterium]